MQYATIIVDHKAGYKPLTYSIPPALLGHLSVGSVVRVPIGPQSVHGVVVDFVRRLESELANKIKPITSVVYGEQFVSDYVLQTVAALHRHYAIGAHDLLFALLPPLPKKQYQGASKMGIHNPAEFRVSEYIAGAVERVALFRKIASAAIVKGQSVLILCATQAAVTALADSLADLPVAIYPHKPTPKQRRDYYFGSIASTQPKVAIGTRGALITPLQSFGAIIIDEPWLPGHKEEQSPKLWSSFMAKALCQARGIPLYLVSAKAWPETALLGKTKPIRLRTQAGTIHLTANRPLTELIAHFFGEYDAKNGQLAIFVRENNHPVCWCRECATTREYSARVSTCFVCHAPLLTLPVITSQSVEHTANQLAPQAKVSVFPVDSLLQYRHFDAALALGFDSFLSIVDYRSEMYLATLVALLRSQSTHLLFATKELDIWTQLLQHTAKQTWNDLLAERRAHRLPPFSLPVTFSSRNNMQLQKLAQTATPAPIIWGKIQPSNHGFTQSCLIPPQVQMSSLLPDTAHVTIDVLPHYVISAHKTVSQLEQKG